MSGILKAVTLSVILLAMTIGLWGCGGGGGGEDTGIQIQGFDPPSAPPGRMVRISCTGINSQSQDVWLSFSGSKMRPFAYGDKFVDFCVPAVNAGSYEVKINVQGLESESADFRIDAIPAQPYTQEEFSRVVSEGMTELGSIERSLFEDIDAEINLYDDDQFAEITNLIDNFQIFAETIQEDIQNLSPEDALLLQCMYNQAGLLSILDGFRNAASVERDAELFESIIHDKHFLLYKADQLSALFTNFGPIIDAVNIALALKTILTGGALAPVFVTSVKAKFAMIVFDYLIDTAVPTDLCESKPYRPSPIVIDFKNEMTLGESQHVTFMGYFRCQDNYVASTFSFLLESILFSYSSSHGNQPILDEIEKQATDAIGNILTNNLGINISSYCLSEKFKGQGDNPLFYDMPYELEMSLFNYGLSDIVISLFGIDLLGISDLLKVIDLDIILSSSVQIGDGSILGYDFETEQLKAKNIGSTSLTAIGWSMTPENLFFINYEKKTAIQSLPLTITVIPDVNQPPNTKIESGCPTGTWTSPGITLYVSGTDDTTPVENLTYEWSANKDHKPEQGWTPDLDDEIGIWGLSTGWWDIWIRAVDEDGIKDPYPAVCGFYADIPGGDDTDPPLWDSTVGITEANPGPGDLEITVKWGVAQDEESPPVSYLVYKDTDNNPFDQTPVVKPAGTLSYVFSGLMDGQTYWFGVRCRDSANPANTDGNSNVLSAEATDEQVFDPQIIKTVDMPDQAYGIAVSGDYAYVGGLDGFHIIDINPPLSAYIVKIIGSYSVEDVAVLNGYAYAACYSGLQIIDIEPASSANVVKTVNTPGQQALGVAVSGGYAYVADYSSGLQIIDIEPASSAYIVKTVDTPDQAYGVAVSGGYAYVADNLSGLQIIDIEPASSAHIVKSVNTLPYAFRVAVSGSYAYVTSGKVLHIIDIDPPSSADIVASVDMSNNGFSVEVSGGYAYIASWYGLTIVDIEPPSSAHAVNYTSTGSYTKCVAISGEYAYLTDNAKGLLIIQLY